MLSRSMENGSEKRGYVAQSFCLLLTPATKSVSRKRERQREKGKGDARKVFLFVFCININKNTNRYSNNDMKRYPKCILTCESMHTQNGIANECARDALNTHTKRHATVISQDGGAYLCAGTLNKHTEWCESGDMSNISATQDSVLGLTYNMCGLECLSGEHAI